MRTGAFAFLPSPDGVLAFERSEGEERRVVVVNFTASPVAVPLEGPLSVEVSSCGDGEGDAYRVTDIVALGPASIPSRPMG